MLQTHELFQKYHKKSCVFRKSTQSVDRHVENDVDCLDQGARLSGNSIKLHKKEAQVFWESFSCTQVISEGVGGAGQDFQLV